MKKILVPCDFSKHAVNAYRFALDLSLKSKGSVHLLNVIQLPVIRESHVMPSLAFEEAILEEMRDKSEARFKKMIGKYRVPGAIVSHRVVFGSIQRMILDTIRKEKTDLVVMGSHGASGIRELFIGSNAEKVVRTSPVPVIIIKEFYKGPVKNIVFPNTLETAKQEDLIMKVKALQDFFKARLHIVWINTPTNFTVDTESHERLAAFARRFMLKDYTLNVFNYPNQEEGIIAFANMMKADMIAMGTHGRKGFAHWVLGSKAEDVVNHGLKPIWTTVMPEA